jgi:hypothetical protein
MKKDTDTEEIDSDEQVDDYFLFDEETGEIHKI